MKRMPATIRAASILYVVPGVGLAVSVAAILAYDAARGELPMTPFGWRLMGGPYEQIGTDTLTPFGRVLAGTLIAVSILDVVAGIWLSQGRRRGAMLALVNAPISFALGVAFVVPFLLIVPPIRALLAMAGWRSLR